MSERIGDVEREWARASEREGSEQHCRHSPTVTVPQPEDRGSTGNSRRGYDGGGRPHRPSAAQSPTLTASLWDHPANSGAKRKKLFSLSFTRPITGPQLLQDWHHTPHTHTSLPSLLLHSQTLTHTLSNWSTPHFLLPFGRAFFSFLFFFFPLRCLRWPSELSGFTFILWWTMGLGWRGASGTLQIRTEGSRYLLVTLLLFCGFWKARAQTDDGKTVYFWETGTAKPLIRDYIWSLVLHMERLWW